MSNIDIIAESGITGKDFTDAARALSMQLMKREREGKGEAPSGKWNQVARLCKAGALLGNGDCMSMLGDQFYGKKTDEARACEDTLAEAVKWWNKAAEAGNGRGACNIGLLYMGKEIPGAGNFGKLEYNEEEALKYFIMGHELGDMKAGRHVGLCYLEGKGAEKDPVKAYEWFQKAAERGDSSSALYIADCKLEGIGTEQDIDGAIADYIALVECKGHDVTNAAYKLACLYRDGTFVEKDPEKSRFYFESVIKTATLREADQKAEAMKELGL